MFLKLSCDFSRILCRNYVSNLYIEKNFEAKGGKKRKKERERERERERGREKERTKEE